MRVTLRYAGVAPEVRPSPGSGFRGGPRWGGPPARISSLHLGEGGERIGIGEGAGGTWRTPGQRERLVC